MEDNKVTETLNKEAVTSLDISMPHDFRYESYNQDDTIDAIIFKYSEHPSIIKMIEVVKKEHFFFHLVDLPAVDNEIATYAKLQKIKSSKSSELFRRKYRYLWQNTVQHDKLWYFKQYF